MKKPARSSKINIVLRAYLYIFIGIGIILMSFGFYGIGKNIYQRSLLPKYPLGNGYESRCEYLDIGPVEAKINGYTEVEADEVYSQNLRRVEECQANLEAEREVRKVTDLYNSIIVFVIGLIIFSGHLWVNLKSEK